MDLKLSGFSVDCACDGHLGLQKALNNDFDLIILDVMMPKMDGFEVCKNIRKSAKDVPIILLTAKGTIEDKVVGFNCGADDYLVKPFDIQELFIENAGGLCSGVQKLLLNAPKKFLRQEMSNYLIGCETSINGKIIKLTPTEFEILYCLMRHVNQAVNLTTLLNEVWGYSCEGNY